MTIDKRQMVHIPQWILSFALPIMISAVIGLASGMFAAGRATGSVTTQVVVNTKRLDEVEKSKVTPAEILHINNSLERIETKLSPTRPVIK
jgi:hypothetical protein